MKSIPNETSTKAMLSLLLIGTIVLTTFGCETAVIIPVDTTSIGKTAAVIPHTLAGKAATLTNQKRSAKGLAELAWNDKLAKAAVAHAQDMAKRNYFAHKSLKGRQVSNRVATAGYTYSWVGENIAMGQTTAAKVIDDWMASKGHRQNILRKQFTQVGIAVVPSPSGTYYWVQVFGRPAGS